MKPASWEGTSGAGTAGLAGAGAGASSGRDSTGFDSARAFQRSGYRPGLRWRQPQLLSGLERCRVVDAVP